MDKFNLIGSTIENYYRNTHTCVSEELIESILYSIEAGGKRLRPLILLEVLEGFGKTVTEAHYQIAAALEMIHTGSLIHDDLPAMDNDDYRRGRLTNHKQFDEATAILAGDSLFLDAFDLVARADLPSPIIVQLVQFLATSSGTFGMVGGQMLDMKGEGQMPEATELFKIHENKTGRLLTYPFYAAGIIAEQSEYVQGRLWQLGSLIGYAFQIRDDILDVTASFEELGKTPNKDLVAEKATFPALLGLVESKSLLEEALDKSIKILEELTQDYDFKSDNIIKILESLRINE